MNLQTIDSSVVEGIARRIVECKQDPEQAFRDYAMATEAMDPDRLRIEVTRQVDKLRQVRQR